MKTMLVMAIVTLLLVALFVYVVIFMSGAVSAKNRQSRQKQAAPKPDSSGNVAIGYKADGHVLEVHKCCVTIGHRAEDMPRNRVAIGRNAHALHDSEVVITFTDGTEFRADLPDGKTIDLGGVYWQEEK